MKIVKLIIRGFQQFQDFHLDLSDADTGQPVDKVCFIGPNGTGKSTLLRLIHDELLRGLSHLNARRGLTGSFPLMLCKISSSEGSFWIHGPIGGAKGLLRETVEVTWFLDLRRRIKRTANPAEKRQLIDEYMQIGNAYNFAADALPQENP